MHLHDMLAMHLQVYEPIDHLHLFGQDPLNDIQLGATYYIATGDSGQGAPLMLHGCDWAREWRCPQPCDSNIFHYNAGNAMQA